MNTPQVHLCVKNSRVKKYGDSYFLQNGTEFQLEFFNPTQDNICAQIEINGKSETSGLVLRPGQRYHIDRFLDNDHKMIFETYEVGANDAEVKSAIAKNGQVKVSFYKQKKTVVPSLPKIRRSSSINYSDHNLHNISGNLYKGNYTGNQTVRGYTGPDLSTNAAYFSSEVNTRDYSPSFSTHTTDTFARNLTDTSTFFDQNTLFDKAKTEVEELIETGRVEMGEKSNQVFETVDYKFEYYAFSVTSFTIKPMSAKPEDTEVAMYCCTCGRKARKDEKFCPKCGNNLDEQRKNL